MSDINLIIVESLGFHGVNMHNTDFPCYCGTNKEFSSKEGKSAVSLGGSNYAKEESLSELPNTHGKSAISYGNTEDYADHEKYVTGGGGRPAVIYKR